jgi:predicted nucleic acid-binding protein
LKRVLDTNAILYLLGGKLPDAIVAATALSLQAQLVTNDTKLLRVPSLTCQRLELKSV